MYYRHLATLISCNCEAVLNASRKTLSSLPLVWQKCDSIGPKYTVRSSLQSSHRDRAILACVYVCRLRGHFIFLICRCGECQRMCVGCNFPPCFCQCRQEAEAALETPTPVRRSARIAARRQLTRHRTVAWLCTKLTSGVTSSFGPPAENSSRASYTVEIFCKVIFCFIAFKYMHRHNVSTTSCGMTIQRCILAGFKG